MKRVQIRSTILLCVALIVDGCCLGMYMQPYSLIQCNDNPTTLNSTSYDDNAYVFGTWYGATCVSAKGQMTEMLWMNDYQRNGCTAEINEKSYARLGSNNPCGEWKDAGDAFGGAVGLIGAAMFFNNFIALCAILELMKYTVGSKCQAAYVIVGGILTMCLALAAGALCFAPGMTSGNERVASSFCQTTCGLTEKKDLTTVKSGHIGPAPVGALIGGIFAIAEIVIGILMCAQAQRDKETLTSSGDLNKVTPL